MLGVLKRHLKEKPQWFGSDSGNDRLWPMETKCVTWSSRESGLKHQQVMLRLTQEQEC